MNIFLANHLYYIFLPSIWIDFLGNLAPQSFLPLLEKKKKNVPINFHFAKQVNSSANKSKTDFFEHFAIRLAESTETEGDF